MISDLPDAAVDAALDAELRALLATCFTGPHDARFKTQRFFNEPPAHRWIVRENGRLIAHLAIHDKITGTPVGDHRIAGVAEVCVHPLARGRGLVKQLLAASDAWCAAQGMPFAMLFGKHEVYRSSGYRPVTNPIRYWDGQAWRVAPIASAMVKPLASADWPAGDIDLRGPLF